MTFIHSTPVGSVFDYTAFVDEGFESQQKYANAAGEAGPLDGDLSNEQRYKKIIEHFGHLTEESIEARVYVPRRSWKNNEPSYLDNQKLREEFVAEMFDVLLFHRAILAYAGVTGEEFAQAAAAKMNYNSKRPDHNVNGTAEAERDPGAELKGECPSANYAEV
jgi:hypothetical protein